VALNEPRQLEAVVVLDAHVRLRAGDLLNERHDIAALVDRDLEIEPDARGRADATPRIAIVRS
jgi:hypothetical protein